MTPEAVIKLANQLNDEVVEYLNEEQGQRIQKVNIKVDPYFISATANGRYSYVTNTVFVNHALVNDKDIKTVILHELCHAYAGPKAHHGPVWKNLALIVGYHFDVDISRCNFYTYDEALSPKAVAMLECPCCHKKWIYYRKGKIYKTEGKGYYCSECGSEKGKLVFTKLR
ncbi:MAG TPA: hypothetical protein DDW20_04900 [Firmicutes bacterium]|nr:hypothetical protein [Bacillota bacterium]